MIRFKCTECRTTLKVRDEHSGAKIKCPECRELLRVPRELDEEDEADERPRKPSKSRARRPADDEVDDRDEREDREERDERPRKCKKKRKKEQSGSSRKIFFGSMIALLGVMKIVGGLLSGQIAMQIIGPIAGLGLVAAGIYYARKED